MYTVYSSHRSGYLVTTLLQVMARILRLLNITNTHLNGPDSVGTIFSNYKFYVFHFFIPILFACTISALLHCSLNFAK